MVYTDGIEISLGTVRRISNYMSESSAERTFRRDLAVASARLVAAIAATGRGYA